MSGPSPPKPWERVTAGATSTPMAAPAAMSNPISNPASTTAMTTASTAPVLPERSTALNSVVNQTASNYSAYGANRFSSPYGASPFGGGMYGSSYGGGYGSMYGSGYGGMGVGGYGSMYNRNPYMSGMPGQMNVNDPNASLTQTWNQQTQATFQIMESIVGAFGGFAQMLESAYMTTHSSFFAMVSMAEQLGNLRQTVGQVLGIYTLIRWIRTLLAKLTGRPPPADATALTPANFGAFLTGGPASNTLPDGSPAPPRASKKPFIMFALAVFGLPYLMSKLIRSMAKNAEAEQARQLAAQGIVVRADGSQTIDPSKLDFCRVLYDYTPAQQSVGMDLEVKKGDLVAVLSKTDPMGQPSEWWRCRSRDGKMGYLPGVYLEKIERRQPQTQAQAQLTQTAHENGAMSLPGSRTTTLKGSDTDGTRTKSLSSVAVPASKEAQGLEGFQKSAFYS